MEGPNLKHHLSPPESGRLRLLLKMCCVQFSPSKYLCGPSLGHSLFRLPTCCAHGCRNAHRPEFEVSVGGPGIVVFLLSFLLTLHDLGPRGSKARIHLLRTWLVEVWRPGSPSARLLPGDRIPELRIPSLRNHPDTTQREAQQQVLTANVKHQLITV